MLLFHFSRSAFLASVVLTAVTLLNIPLAHADDDESRRSMTGVWYTKGPAGWIVQTEFGVFSGETQMRWELNEDANGLIQGFNIWHAVDPAEGLGIGAMCMVGAREGSRVVITEASVLDRLLPTFEFSCTQRKGRTVRCLGAGFSSQPPVALEGKLRKVKDSAERDASLAGVAIDAVRDFCQGSLPTPPVESCEGLPHLSDSCAPLVE